MTTQATPAEQAVTQQKAAPAAKPAVEKQTNCLACNKPIKKLKRYYRDGKFYCSKKCWKTYISKSKEEKK
jgi:predicted transcriptional regulator